MNNNYFVVDQSMVDNIMACWQSYRNEVAPMRTDPYAVPQTIGDALRFTMPNYGWGLLRKVDGGWTASSIQSLKLDKSFTFPLALVHDGHIAVFPTSDVAYMAALLHGKAVTIDVGLYWTPL